MNPSPLFSKPSSPTLLGLPPIRLKGAIPLIFSMVLFLGCKDAPKGADPGEGNGESQVHLEGEKKAETSWIDEISLDQGAKWTANIETTAGVSDMLALIEKSAAESAEDHRKLGDGLAEIKNMIVRECTMTGPSHDNLHVWLYPLISKIERLQKAESKEAGARMTEEIQDHLVKYHDYFE